MPHETILFKPLKIKSIEIKNRIWVSPMCQYSSQNGHPTDWHFVHLGSRAVGGAGLIMVEATAVSPEGRISPDDSGIWDDEHIDSFKRLVNFIKSQQTVCGIQLAHAGRKGSTAVPWRGHHSLSSQERGWETVAPSAAPFEGYAAPREMSESDIQKVVKDFEEATIRSLKAGFQIIELHMAHGYLLHEFLSPLSNFRTDQYGGPLENRMRFPLMIAKAVRSKWPGELPLFVRISATDWAETASNSWTLNDSLVFSKKLKEVGVDLIDCSSGGTLAKAKIPVGPGYQVSFSETIRKEVNILTAAVGMITEPAQAEQILQSQKADAVFMAREFLRNPYWPMRAAQELKITIQKPNQYARS